MVDDTGMSLTLTGACIPALCAAVSLARRMSLVRVRSLSSNTQLVDFYSVAFTSVTTTRDNYRVVSIGLCDAAIVTGSLITELNRLLSHQRIERSDGSFRMRPLFVRPVDSTAGRH